MQRIEAIIAVAGWEERFAKGLLVELNRHPPRQLVVFAFEEYLDQTQAGRAEARVSASECAISYREVLVTREPTKLWKIVREELENRKWTQRLVLLDITTMPRELIWWAFSALQAVDCQVSYVYHKPGGYPEDWVTRDTDRPRLVYQHSGISVFGRGTCLLIVSGFDTDRIAQLIQFFEPRAVTIGLQLGDQYENQRRNVDTIQRLLGTAPNVRFFEMDAYSSDHGLAAMEEAIKAEMDRYNIVATSLGPKPSAVALYRLQRKYPDIALAYAPSRQFNMNYSIGIGGSIDGEL